jgi:hypothetical protein
MIKNIILLALFACFSSLAQNSLEAPWMQELIADKNLQDLTYDEIKAAGDAYWENRDKDAKGSGYKPYMRWLEKSKSYVTDDGTLQTNAELQAELERIVPKSTLIDDSNWVPMGPFIYTNTGSWSAGQGRVNSMTVDPNDPNTYYIGTPGGGTWKSTDAGVNWTPLNDFITRVGSSAVAIDPNNSDIIYVGTGDDDAGDSPSIGLLKSTDGGATFNPTGLNFFDSFSNISEVYIDPTNSNKIIVSSSRGFYMSLNAGATFTRTLFGNVKDIKFKPNDPNTIYLSTLGDFYVSTDGGFNWSNSTVGLPNAMNRSVIAVTPANVNMVYMLLIDSSSSLLGVYRSTNSGLSFTRRDSGVDILESSQGWFDLALEVSPTNPNIIFTGCLNIWRSANGGSSFTRLNEWNRPTQAAYTHADIHQIRQFGTELFAMTDGGIYRSNNNGISFTDLTATAQIGQFYRVAVGASSADIAGGLQDNGGFTRSGDAWGNYYGADGMEAGVSQSNALVRYGFTQFGGGLYFTTDGINRTGSYNGPEQGNWITPLKTDSQGTIYAGYSRLYKVGSSGFESVSSSSFSGNIDVLEIDPNDDNTIYVADSNVLYRSSNAGVDFNAVEFFSNTISAIEVNGNDSNIVYVALTGATGDVRRSIDRGNTFTDITYNLPNLGKNALAHQPLNVNDILYVATTAGVYKLEGSSTSWETFDNNLPNTDIRDLEINPNDGIITAATYGRGVWQSALPVAPAPNDVMLTSIGTTGASISCSDGSIEVEVTNNGSTALTNVTLDYSINNAAIVNQSFTVNINPGDSSTLTLTGVNLVNGNNELFVEAGTPNDAFASNNSRSISLTKNTTALINVANTFENEDLLKVEASGGTVTWERGIPNAITLNSAGAGADGFAYATNLDGEYSDDVTSYLYSGCYDLTNVQQPILQFEMSYAIEENWDVLYVEVSTDQGNSWEVLGSSSDANWYNSNRQPTNRNCQNCVGAQWTGTNASMNVYQKALDIYSNETNVIFRFVFRSDASVTEDGAVIDNLIVTGTLSNKDVQIADRISVYPNPSDGIFNLNWEDDATVLDLNVYDLSGKLILTKSKVTGGRDQIDLTQVAQGVYFLNIDSANGSITKKLIVK